jgi:hypothetical protein
MVHRNSRFRRARTRLTLTPPSIPFCSVDPFSKKDWYDIKAPSVFNTRNVGKTLVTRTAGTKVRRWWSQDAG